MAEPQWFVEKCQEEPPGWHVGENKRGPLVTVLHDPWKGQPYSPRARFLVRVMLPVFMVALVMALLIAHNLGA